MRGRMGRDLLLCIIRVMECGWGLHEVMVMWLIRRGRLYFGLERRSPIILLIGAPSGGPGGRAPGGGSGGRSPPEADEVFVFKTLKSDVWWQQF